MLSVTKSRGELRTLSWLSASFRSVTIVNHAIRGSKGPESGVLKWQNTGRGVAIQGRPSSSVAQHSPYS